MKNNCKSCISLFEIDGDIHCSEPKSPRFRQGFKWPGPGCENWASAHGDHRRDSVTSAQDSEVQP